MHTFSRIYTHLFSVTRALALRIYTRSKLLEGWVLLVMVQT